MTNAFDRWSVADLAERDLRDLRIAALLIETARVADAVAKRGRVKTGASLSLNATIGDGARADLPLDEAKRLVDTLREKPGKAGVRWFFEKPAPPPSAEPFARTLAALLEARSLTAYRLAEDAGLSRQAVAKLLAGSAPSWETVQRIAAALGVSTEDLRDR
jgi:DNA-binding XRE family transcriptional regulator